MLRLFLARFTVACCALFVSACATAPKVPGGYYSAKTRGHIYALKTWQLAGRLAISSPKDSWSANIEWRHQPELEKIKLSGPLGQGAVLIELAEDSVKIDHGGGKVLTSNQPEDFINQQLGMFVPLHSLRYWATGIPKSGEDYQATSDGFVQDGWLVAYKDMRETGTESLPHKLTVSGPKVKLKLIIDEWDLHGGKANE